MQDIGLAEDGLWLNARAAGGGAEDFLLLVRERVVHPDVEHEAVELRLGERVGAFLPRWGFASRGRRTVPSKFVGGVSGGDHLFLHRFEERGLGLGRGAVDFVGEEQVAKNGAADEAETPSRRWRNGFEDVGADDSPGMGRA